MIRLANLVANSGETIELTAIIDTALSVGAGGSSGSLADKPIIRSAEGNLLLPASQLKGRLRHECEKLARGLKWPICQSPKAVTMCPQRQGLENETSFHRPEYLAEDSRYHCLICQIFGNPSLPSRLICDDLICTTPSENLPSEVLRPGVTINRRRGTAEDDKLYFRETSPVAQLRFTGSVRILPSRNFGQSLHPDYPKALILTAIKHINALGGSKSTGLGWLHWEYTTPNINPQVWEDLARGETDERD